MAFLWSVRNGQYQDTYTPSVRMLFDEGKSEESKKVKEENLKEKKSTS